MTSRDIYIYIYIYIYVTPVALFLLPLRADIKSKHQSLKCDFRQAVVNRLAFNFAVPSFGAAVTEGNIAFFLAQNSKDIHKVALPNQAPKKVTFVFSFHDSYVLELWLIYIGHDSKSIYPRPLSSLRFACTHLMAQSGLR